MADATVVSHRSYNTGLQMLGTPPGPEGAEGPSTLPPPYLNGASALTKIIHTTSLIIGSRAAQFYTTAESSC